MDKQTEFVLRTLEERDIRFVRLWFTDVLGFLKSVAVAPAELEVSELPGNDQGQGDRAGEDRQPDHLIGPVDRAGPWMSRLHALEKP